MNWLIAHLIGDYILQNDWMAQRKKGKLFPPLWAYRYERAMREWRCGTCACTVHVTLYTMVMWAMTGWPFWAIAVVFVTHYLQDRTNVIAWWMKTMGQKGFAMPPLAPWSTIVVDNTWHLIVLYALSLSCA